MMAVFRVMTLTSTRAHESQTFRKHALCYSEHSGVHLSIETFSRAVVCI
jgi:hypothetical protein